MKAIDFRFRPNTPDAVDGLIHSPFFGDMCAFFNYPDRAWSASLDKIVEIMDEHEITGVITGRDVETTYGCPCSNMGVVEMMRAYPHKFYGMAGLDPHKGMQAIDELSRMVNEFGMKGASIDPYLAKLPADHRKFYPIYAKCCELKVPVVISTGPGTRVPGAIMGDASPARVDEVARDFPDLTVVMSHGGYPYVQEACMVCHRNANVYMEWSEYETWPFADGNVKPAPTPSMTAGSAPSCTRLSASSPTCSRTSCTTTPPAYWGLRRIISRGRGLSPPPYPLLSPFKDFRLYRIPVRRIPCLSCRQFRKIRSFWHGFVLTA